MAGKVRDRHNYCKFKAFMTHGSLVWRKKEDESPRLSYWWPLIASYNEMWIKSLKVRGREIFAALPGRILHMAVWSLNMLKFPYPWYITEHFPFIYLRKYYKGLCHNSFIKMPHLEYFVRDTGERSVVGKFCYLDYICAPFVDIC